MAGPTGKSAAGAKKGGKKAAEAAPQPGEGSAHCPEQAPSGRGPQAAGHCCLSVARRRPPHRLVTVPILQRRRLHPLPMIPSSWPPCPRRSATTTPASACRWVHLGPASRRCRWVARRCRRSLRCAAAFPLASPETLVGADIDAINTNATVQGGRVYDSENGTTCHQVGASTQCARWNDVCSSVACVCLHVSIKAE